MTPPSCRRVDWLPRSLPCESSRIGDHRLASTAYSDALAPGLGPDDRVKACLGRASWREKAGSEVAVGGEAVVDSGDRGPDSENSIAFGEPIDKFATDARLDFDEWGRRGSGCRLKARRERSDKLVLPYSFGVPADGNGTATSVGDGQVNVGGTFAWSGVEVVDRGDDALGIQMPFDEQAVGGQAAVQWARGDAIEVCNVAAADGAEAVDVEVSVFCFERIEGPFDEANAAAESVFALKEL